MRAQVVGCRVEDVTVGMSVFVLPVLSLGLKSHGLTEKGVKVRIGAVAKATNH